MLYVIFVLTGMTAALYLGLTVAFYVKLRTNLSFDGVKTIGDTIAVALSKREDSPSLAGISTLSYKSALALGEHVGQRNPQVNGC